MKARYSKILIALTGMILSDPSYAQQHLPANWSVATHIPPGSGQTDQPGLAGCISGIYRNNLLIAGGSNFPGLMPWEGGKKHYYKGIFALKFSEGHSPVWISAGPDSLTDNLAYSACTSTPAGVFSAGGENENGIVRSAFLLLTDSMTQAINRIQLPDLPVAVTNAAAACADHTVFVAGGETKDGVSKSFYCLNTDHPENGWQQLPDLPAPTSHAVMVVRMNRHQACVYLIGGRCKTASGISELYDQVYAYDVKSSVWTPKASLPYALCAGTGIADDRYGIFLFGGDRGTTFHQVESLLTEIGREPDPAKKQQLTEKKNELQLHHPGFSAGMLKYSFRKNKWRVCTTLPFTIPVTTHASYADGLICIPGGEIRAGVRTAQVITGTLK